jgi:trans-aconitate methyltransferase
MFFPGKQAILDRFSRAAPVYDAWAEPQKQIARRLAAMLPARPAGMIAWCRRRWPRGEVADFCVGDAETFRADARYALAAACSVFQWFGDPAAAARRVRAALAPGGVFAMAVPVEGTLGELAASYREAAGRTMPGIDLLDAPRYTALLEEAGLAPRVAAVEDVRVYYRRPRALLRALRAIGATFTPDPALPPLDAARTRRLLRVYRERFGARDGRVPATYRVLYALSEPVA